MICICGPVHSVPKGQSVVVTPLAEDELSREELLTCTICGRTGIRSTRKDA